MTKSITATFEGGLLRPTTPLALPEGTRVELIIVTHADQDTRAGRRVARILAEIAALPTSGGDPRTGRDHDRVLYGQQGAR
jgi:predicted DNA-binding antitoxin AbrB/MazE fold protein